METKIFKESQIRGLLDQVYKEKITFSKFVEILNNQCKSDKLIKQIDTNQKWFKCLVIDNCGLSESETIDAFIDISKKINEVINRINLIK